EKASADWARKSLTAVRDLPAGTVLSAADLVAQRPGTGLSPDRLGDVLGRRLGRAVAAGTPLISDMLA
ncbi:MAG: hypothetical protein KDE22_18905, partial [Rhodobacterales bacterium]|nr:hypothetical protein [Rhodobacterales bacterium]